MGFARVKPRRLRPVIGFGDRIGSARTTAMFALLPLADIASPSHSSSGTSVWVFIGVAVAVVAIGLGILWVLRSRRAGRSAIAADETASATPQQAEDTRD